MKYLLEIDVKTWRKFISICKGLGSTAAGELRTFIDSFIAKHESKTNK